MDFTAGLAVLTLWLLLAPPAGADANLAVRLVIGVCARDRSWSARHRAGRIPQVGRLGGGDDPLRPFSVGSLLVSPGARLEGALFAAVAVLTFFAGIDAARRP